MTIKDENGMTRKVKPYIKFNSGMGAILCNYCSVIIKEFLTKDEFDGKTDLLFCEKHKNMKNA